MIKKVDHIGIAVKSIAEQVAYYRDVLGLPFLGEEEVENQQVKVAMFQAGEIRIELLEATSDESPIAKFIAKKGQGIHHVAYHSDNIKEDLDNAKKQDIRLINETPQMGADNKQIAFMHPKSTFGVLTELCSEE
ncbi:methylmalonyl-CoA epimerase [Candidatus Uabimicrobium amorphum]|uniref:Methylmalonyl-CoA epimerase n=1 Tax=Uabimicrobium amorphum TaxID=2596890 RepID=A0A5S9IIL1_UABAM|nr:methylmalonyl-CoA epimerase [Candidatus Uabimicrobium amorphum]BBM82518.1 methylmalonyl-CoA epimerase [Candidatus Uabimicrobium amorphum]